ncbi:MAG: transglutaminase domain-containing protein [Gemmatimonadota bacterium]
MTPRRALGGAILVVWLGLVGWQIRRVAFRAPEALLAASAASLGPGSFFYTVRSDDQAIGIASSRLDTLPDGFIYDDLLTLDVPALDSVHRATVRTELTLDEALGVRGFAFDLDSEIGRFSAAGEAGEDGVLALTIDDGSGGGRAHRLPADVLLPSALTLRLAASGRLEVGAELSARVFDPSVLDTRDVRLVVTARDTVLVPDSVTWQPDSETWRIETYDTVPAWTIEQEFAGVRVRSRVDAEGRLVTAESPLGFSMQRTAFELARSAWEDASADPTNSAGYGSIIESTAIATGVLDDARARDGLAVRLLNVELEGFDLAGGRQALAGDTLRVTTETLGADAGWALPWTAPPGIPPADLARSLAATPLVQSDDPRIQEAARAIVGGEMDPTAVARLINEWVYDALEKNVTLSLPSALQVLDAREGDCNEHTVLYVALARSLGLPARTAAGLVHMGERFYYHAWPEVWLDDRWVAVDPTLGQFPADASHLRFLVGGLARQVELLRLIGRLRLEVVA